MLVIQKKEHKKKEMQENQTLIITEKLIEEHKKR